MTPATTTTTPSVAPAFALSTASQAVHDALAEAAAQAPWQSYICNACGYVYYEADGDPDGGLPPGTRLADIPDDWACLLCGVTKADFSPYEAPTLEASLTTKPAIALAPPPALHRAGIDGLRPRTVCGQDVSGHSAPAVRGTAAGSTSARTR